MPSNQQEELFAELTPAEGAAIAGGATYYLGNKANIGVNYLMNGNKRYLAPGKEVKYSFSKAPYVIYDEKIGAGYEPKTVKLKKGKNNFDRIGNKLILGTVLVPNVVSTSGSEYS